MSETPKWLVQLLDAHVKLFDFRNDYIECSCGERPVHSMHRPHVADMVWAEILRRSGNGRDWIGFLYDGAEPLSPQPDPRVIPSRTGDPATSRPTRKP